MQSGGINIRIVVMNNVLPRVMRMHFTYDLKGSTYKRRASRKEREKSNPTFKDLDFLQDMHEGLYFDTETYNALMKTLQRDCRVRKYHCCEFLWNVICDHIIFGCHLSKEDPEWTHGVSHLSQARCYPMLPFIQGNGGWSGDYLESLSLPLLVFIS
jgi:hypothetical protein